VKAAVAPVRVADHGAVEGVPGAASDLDLPYASRARQVGEVGAVGPDREHRVRGPLDRSHGPVAPGGVVVDLDRGRAVGIAARPVSTAVRARS
jgi:hypothetical protein